MATNGVPAHETMTTARRSRFMTSGLWLRLFFALLISWLIVMALFATNALSH